MSERCAWQCRGPVWTRMGRGRVRIAVRPSAIHGRGLFWESDSPGHVGMVLGSLSGCVLFSDSSRAKATRWASAQRDDRLVLLERGERTVVVDACGSVFEFLNCACEADATVHVRPRGIVELRREVWRGDELTWWYGWMPTPLA